MRDEVKDRIKHLSFGDKVTNVCAGDNNPCRLSSFVKVKSHSRRNRYGITHTQRYVMCTDGRGKFWETTPEVIFPGHLSVEESDRLYRPIWEAKYGKKWSDK